MFKAGLIIKMHNRTHWYCEKNRYCYADNIGDNKPLDELPKNLYVVIGHICLNFTYAVVVYDLGTKIYRMLQFHIFAREEDGLKLVSDNYIKAQLITLKSLETMQQETDYRFLITDDYENVLRKNRKKIESLITDSCYSVGDKVTILYHDGIYEIKSVVAYDLKRYAMVFQNKDCELKLVLPLNELTLVERAKKFDKVQNTDVVHSMINNNYVVKFKVPLYISRTKKGNRRISHMDIKAEKIYIESDAYILDLYLSGSYLILRCYDMSEKEEYRVFVDLDYDIESICDIVSNDVEKNKIKIKLMNKDLVLCNQRSSEIICTYRNKLMEQAKEFLEKVHCDLYYIGDTVSYHGNNYIITAIRGHYNVTLVNEKEKRNCRTEDIELVERASYMSPLHNTRF